MLISLKRKSTIVTLLMMLWSLLAGCAGQSYDELDIEARRTGDTTKIDKREAQYEKAVLFRDNKLNCLASRDHAWVCMHKTSSDRIRKTQSEVSIDGTIREYRRDQGDGCVCVKNSELSRIFR